MRRTTVNLSDQLDAKLRHEAERRGITVSELTREATSITSAASSVVYELRVPATADVTIYPSESKKSSQPRWRDNPHRRLRAALCLG